MHVWLNGGMVEATDAHVGLDDHGLVVGGGAFETLKIVRGEPFAMRRHLARLGRTLDALAIPRPSDTMLRAAAREVIDASELGSARLRITVTGGKGPLGSGSPSGPPTVIAIAGELSGQPPPTAITVPWTRNEHGALTGLKTTSYAENVRALHVAHEAGTGEALFANTAGQLCEGTGTNVFVVIGNEVVTPPLSSGCLPGITRELVTEVADVVERAVPLEILRTVDEVFLTSSTRDVQGLTRIDDRELAVGPVTVRVAAAFADIVANDLDP